MLRKTIDSSLSSPDKISSQFTRLAGLLSATVFSISFLALVIWTIGRTPLRQFMGREISFQSAMALFFGSLALLLAISSSRFRLKEAVKTLLAFVPLLIGCLALIRNFGHFDLIKYPNLTHVLSLMAEYPMANNSAFCAILIALSLLMLDGRRWMNRMAQRFAMSSACIGFFGIASYLISLIGFDGVASFTQMNPTTALSVFMLSVSVLLAKPDVGIVKALRNKNPSGVFARRMMIAAFVIPPVLGWLGLLAVERGVLVSATAWALSSLVSIILFASFVWQSSDKMENFEDTISQSELRFRSMANSIPQLAWMSEPNGEIYWYNQRWYDYTGTTLEQMQGWGWKSVHNPDLLPQTTRTWQAALRSGEPWEDVSQLKGKDGSFRWFLSRAMPLKNEFGEITKWFGSNTDIDNQRKFEAELKHSQERYETLTGAIPQLVWSCLPDGRWDYMSKQWEEYTGMPIHEQLGLSWLENVIHPHDRERTHQHWMRAVQGLQAYDIEHRIRRSDGEYRWFKSRGTAMRNAHGEILSWVGTSTDIHDQKLAAGELYEAKLVAERASQAKSQFLANVSHEIRTPINSIMGFTDLLKSARIPSKDKENFMGVIERNSSNLLRLIDDILDLSKVEAGKIEVEKTIFNLPDFLIDFCSAMSFRAAEKGIIFLIKFSGEIPNLISTDQLRLRQIISNVVGNAIKFTEIGKVELNVSFENEELIFVTSDTGPGISKETQGRLFQPFSQADPTFTRKYGGTGLGLILSKRLSQLLGGDLILSSSEPHIGSSFTLRIKPTPVVGAHLVGVSSLARSERPALRSEEQTVRLSGLKLLLVEDSPDNRMLISMYLKKTGAKIEIAEDGQEGFEKAMASLPDVVLMDIQMPKLDGHSATRMLRAQGFSKPIVALTAHAMREERERCFESGCTDFLTKPIQRDKLVETLLRFSPKLEGQLEEITS